MSITALIGPPGSGKTTMACLTAPKKPVHVIDVDRKIRSLAGLRNAIAKGELTYKEIGETLQEDALAKRLDALQRDEKPARPPKGWTNIANYIGTLESDPEAKAAGTLLIDSYTQTAQHMRAHIQYLKGKSKFQWDDWSTWKAMWAETTIILIDYALATDKDFIVTIHERVSERPGPQTERVMIKVTEKGERRREYIGTMDVLIAGSIEGAFGIEFGTYFTDVYALRVDVEKGVPRWVCRVLPDGQRDLRCSFDTRNAKGEMQAEFRPDLSIIQKVR